MQFMPAVLWTCFTPVVLSSCIQADFWSINMLKMKGLVWFTNSHYANLGQLEPLQVLYKGVRNTVTVLMHFSF